MLLGLRSAHFHVADVNQAGEWYATALGTKPYYVAPDYVGFNIGGFDLGLSPHPAGQQAPADVYWGVGDIQAALAHFLASGATRIADVQDVGGGIRIAVVLDPFGNRLALMENPHFGKQPAG